MKKRKRLDTTTARLVNSSGRVGAVGQCEYPFRKPLLSHADAYKVVPASGHFLCTYGHRNTIDGQEKNNDSFALLRSKKG